MGALSVGGMSVTVHKISYFIICSQDDRLSIGQRQALELKLSIDDTGT